MDLSSLNRGHPGTTPGAHHNPAVETRLEFDSTTGQPYYVAVPAPAGTVVPATPAGAHPGSVTVYPPAPHYPGPPAAAYSPMRDPLICRLVAGGVAVAGGCIGLSFLLQALAAAETALGIVVAGLAVLWLLTTSRGTSDRNVNISISNHNTDRRRR